MLGLSTLGLLVGVLSLFGLWPQWAEFVVWLIVGAAWVTVLHLRIRDHFFWHGAATAFIGGMLGILTQVAFIGMYLQNNPAAAERMVGASESQARLIFLGSGIAISLAYAAVSGLAVWLTFPREVRAALARAREVDD